MSLTAETELDAPADSVRPDPSHLAPRTSDLPLTIIAPRRSWRALELADLWRYRNLLWMFMWRDIKAQQKQTLLGFFWIIAAPLVSVVTMTLVFGRMLQVPSDGFPYPIFLFAGQFLWSQFAAAFGLATNSVVGNAHFIDKIYFPRLLLPISASSSGLINICIVFPMILIVMFALGYSPNWTVVFCPLIILMVLATALGAGLWLAPLNVTFRDVGRIAGYASSIGMYITPVVYPLSILSDRTRWIMALNPMAGYINLFRFCLYGGPVYWLPCVVSLVTTAILLVGGAFFFVRLSGRFADVI